MNHKLAVGDPVTIVSKKHTFAGQTGTITAIGYRIEAKFVGGHTSLEEWELKLAPKVHDRVRVATTVGAYGADEGIVTEITRSGVRVEFDDSSSALFHPVDLIVFDPAPRVRSVGSPIRAKDVKIGDKISVQTKDIMGNDVERVTVLTAVVGKIVERGLNGSTLTFQTSGGNEFYTDSNSKREIVLLESIEEDPIHRDLSSMGPGSVIVFANKPGEPETDMAIKQPFEDQWHLVDGAKDRKPRTVGLVNIIKKKDVTYTVLVRNEIKEGK